MEIALRRKLNLVSWQYYTRQKPSQMRNWNLHNMIVHVPWVMTAYMYGGILEQVSTQYSVAYGA
jgi:hypothetical protein